MNKKAIIVARGALIAAIYAALTLAFQPISFNLVQVRVSEALTLLPLLWAEAVPGLFIGCFLANILGGLGWHDAVFGSLATLAAAALTRYAPNRALAAASPVAVNALAVGGYLSYLTNAPFPLAALYVGCGEAIACFALGLPLLRLAESRGISAKK